MTILEISSIISLAMSFFNFFQFRLLISELKVHNENVNLKSKDSDKPESHLAERLHELQTMKFSDMRRRYK